MKIYKVIDVIHLTENVFKLETERPNLNIVAGQCFNLGVPGASINREYSMYSGSGEPSLVFLIRAIDNGLVSSKLQKMLPGDEIEIDGPYGEFRIPLDKRRSKFFFIASGTGIAPFHSFVKTYPDIDYTIIHGIRYSNETYDANDYEVGRYIPCISSNCHGESSRVTDYLKYNHPPDDALFYLCGNRNMIIDTVEILLSLGIGGNQIVSEVFF